MDWRGVTAIPRMRTLSGKWPLGKVDGAHAFYAPDTSGLTKAQLLQIRTQALWIGGLSGVFCSTSGIFAEITRLYYVVPLR